METYFNIRGLSSNFLLNTKRKKFLNQPKMNWGVNMIFINKDTGNRFNPKKLIQLEEELNQLKENYSYVEKLAKIGSWAYYIDTDEIFWSNEIYN